MSGTYWTQSLSRAVAELKMHTHTFICCGSGWPQSVMWYTHTHTHTHTIPHHTYVYDSPTQAGHKTPQTDALLIPCTPRFNKQQSTVSDTQFRTLAQGWWLSIGSALSAQDSTPSLRENLTRCHCKKACQNAKLYTNK